MSKFTKLVARADAAEERIIAIDNGADASDEDVAADNDEWRVAFRAIVNAKPCDPVSLADKARLVDVLMRRVHGPGGSLGRHEADPLQALALNAVAGSNIQRIHFK